MKKFFVLILSLVCLNAFGNGNGNKFIAEVKKQNIIGAVATGKFFNVVFDNVKWEYISKHDVPIVSVSGYLDSRLKDNSGKVYIYFKKEKGKNWKPYNVYAGGRNRRGNEMNTALSALIVAYAALTE